MDAVKIIQLFAGLAAVATFVAAEFVGLELSAAVAALLGAVAGWTQRRPSELLPPKGG